MALNIKPTKTTPSPGDIDGQIARETAGGLDAGPTHDRNRRQQDAAAEHNREHAADLRKAAIIRDELGHKKPHEKKGV